MSSVPFSFVALVLVSFLFLFSLLNYLCFQKMCKSSMKGFIGNWYENLFNIFNTDLDTTFLTDDYNDADVDPVDERIENNGEQELDDVISDDVSSIGDTSDWLEKDTKEMNAKDSIRMS